VNLLRTPIQAVHTRTITAPRWGGRLTGKSRGLTYTALFVDDKGGGSVVLPGANGSDLADQEVGSHVALARVRHDFGLSFLSVLVTDREHHDGQGHNRVAGPDFQYRRGSHIVTGQALFSNSRTPNRPELAPEWTGQSLSGHAAQMSWSFTSTHFDANAEQRDLSQNFRADAGFVPQVGVRETNGGTGWTLRPNGFVRRLRVFVFGKHQVDRDDDLIEADVTPGVQMDTTLNGFVQVRMTNNRTRAGDSLLTRRQLGYFVRFSPTRRIAQISVDGNAGQEIDFSGARLGRGSAVNLYARLNPTDHLQLELIRNRRALSVSGERLFVSHVSRARGTYNFTSSFFTRAIAQYVSTTRNPLLYLSTVDARSGSFSGSLLVAYKLNWQSVLFVGYGDDRELSDLDEWQPSSRQFFVKVAYAFQR
jgi:hypothetical protein